MFDVQPFHPLLPVTRPRIPRVCESQNLMCVMFNFIKTYFTSKVGYHDHHDALYHAGQYLAWQCRSVVILQDMVHRLPELIFAEPGPTP